MKLFRFRFLFSWLLFTFWDCFLRVASHVSDIKYIPWNRPGIQRKIADIEFVYFIPIWFFSQVVEDGYRFFEKRKVCQSFGL